MISTGLKLRAEKVGARKRADEMAFSWSRKEIKERSGLFYKRKEDIKENKKRLIEILAIIPWNIWEKNCEAGT